MTRLTHEDDASGRPPFFRGIFQGSVPFFVIFAVAVALRVYRLDEIPKGLLFDEAYNGLDVVRILNGARPIFLPDNFGREALFIYLQALSVAAFGPTDLALRAVAVLAGILTVPTSYLLIRRLFNRPVALLTCAWLSVSLWHVLFSRIGLRTILLPLVVAGSFWSLWRGLDDVWDSPPEARSDGASRPGASGLAWFGLAGAGIGLSLYTYTSARFVPIVVAAFAAYLAVFHRRQFAQALPGFFLTTIVALLVFVPEGDYYLHHPAAFVQRASDVSAFNPSLNEGNPTLAFASSVVRTVGMFVWQGDVHWDRNLPGRPVFDPVSSVFLGLGLVVLASRWREPRAAFTIGWLVIMLLPSALTIKDVPNFLRVTGTIPAIFCVPALGATWLHHRWASARWSKGSGLPAVVAGLAFLLGTLLTFHDYFRVWALAPTVRTEFNSDRWTTISTAFRLLNHGSGPLYVGAGDPTGPLQSFALYANPDAGSLRLFDGSRSLPLPPGGPRATYIFAATDLPPSSLLARYAIGPPREVTAASAASPVVMRYTIQEHPGSSLAAHPASVRVGDALEIDGFDFPSDVRAGQSITVRWYWRVLRPDGRNLTFFNQLFDGSGQRRGQLDDRPFAPGYWPAGTTGVSWFDVGVDKDAQTGPLTLLVGVYDRDTMERLALSDPNGPPLDQQLALGPIKVHGSATEVPTVAVPKLVHFADQIDLIGYAMTPVDAKTDGTITLTLDWRARGRPSNDYTIFVHLLDPADKTVAQGDAPPRGGRYPSSLWDAGEVVEDPHLIRVSAVASAGHDRVAVGLYNPVTGRRLAVLDDNGNSIGDTVVLDPTPVP